MFLYCSKNRAEKCNDKNNFSIISRGSQISFWNYYGIKIFCLLNPHIGFKAGIFFTTKKVHFLRIFFAKNL